MINKFTAMGYVGADPQSYKFESGKSKTTFSIGINIGKDTTWVDAECWDKLSDNMEKYLSKGNLVFLEGKLKQSTWKTKEGYTAKKCICACDFIKILSNAIENSAPKEDNTVEVSKKIKEEIEETPW